MTEALEVYIDILPVIANVKARLMTYADPYTCNNIKVTEDIYLGVQRRFDVYVFGDMFDISSSDPLIELYFSLSLTRMEIDEINIYINNAIRDIMHYSSLTGMFPTEIRWLTTSNGVVMYE